MWFGLVADEASVASRSGPSVARIYSALCQSAANHDCVAYRGSGLLPSGLVSQSRQVAVVDRILRSADGVLVLVTLPAVVAVYLPLYDSLNHLASR